MRYQTFLDDSTRHIFVMPNTPVRVLQGMSLIEEKHSLKDQEFEFVKNMFSAIGQVEVVSSHLQSSAAYIEWMWASVCLYDDRSIGRWCC